MSRIIYAKDEDIDLSYEVINDCLFVHVVFTEFSKAVLAKLNVVWGHMKVSAYLDGWDEIFTYTKDPRIVRLIGGAEEIKDPSLHKIDMRMFKWDLTH